MNFRRFMASGRRRDALAEMHLQAGKCAISG